jgi:branched-chain amino acid transport system ATP-binding protein
MSNQNEVLNGSNLVIRFGGLCAVDDVSIRINAGEFIGLIGPNGAGKTTFFNSITGNLVPTSGSITYCGKSLIKKNPAQISHMGISRTFQNIRIFPKMTVLENVCLSLHSEPTYNIFSAILGLPSAKKEDMRIRDEAVGFLDRLGIADYRDHQAGALAYGLQRRLEIARALAAHPKLLLLDEPAAGMNNDECNELVTLLKSIHRDYDLTVMLIEHHIDVVLSLCSRIYVLNLGKLLTEGAPQEIQSNPDVIRAYLGERRKKS